MAKNIKKDNVDNKKVDESVEIDSVLTKEAVTPNDLE